MSNRSYGNTSNTFLQAVRIPWNIKTRLTQFAEANNVTVTSIILRSIEKYLQQYDQENEPEREYGYSYRRKLTQIEHCKENGEGGTED